MTDNLLKDLNDEQKEAVTHFYGPLLVLAGAGSGKTRTIIYRIAYLINNYGVNPKSVLALTFTNKAAREMINRLRNFPKGEHLRNVLATTFHSFGFIFIKENQDIIANGRDLQIIDEEDQLKVISEVVRMLDIDKDELPPKIIKGVINDWKNQGVSLSEYVVDKFFGGYLTDIYQSVLTAYEELKKERGVLDFGDLLYVMYNILKNNDKVLEKYEKRFPFILVDEYQDTNPIQYKILKLLCKNNRNLTVVGDDDQSIYSFRGAEIRNILDFKKDFPDAKIIHLSKNYRSTKNIIEVANSVISKNRQRMRKELYPVKGCGERISLFKNNNEKEEAERILKKIKELTECGYSFNDIAIFYRTNNLSRRFEDILRKEKIPYKIYGSIRFYNRREVKDILSLIRFLINKEDLLSFQRLMGYAIEGVGKSTVDKILLKAKETKDIKKAIESITEVSGRGKIGLALKGFLSLIEKLESAFMKQSPSDFIDLALDLLSYKEHLRKDVKDDKELDERLKNIEELKVALTENQRDGKDYLDFINEIVIEDIEKNENLNSVTLMTVHSAKGLEFPVVFVTALEDDIFPHIFSKNENNIEEERRLFYVAITRAKERLFLSYALTRNNKNQRISPFLNDIPADFIEKERHGFIDRIDNIGKCFLSSDNENKKNKRVFHKFFGTGKIVDTLSEGDEPLYLVRFETGETKRIYGSYLTFEAK
ncbi:MAG: UvrD-helicase domain-containing protein [Proteobacteria bacterium]|nr:UvrD-helicase domain-containing protein [Pseudomonadota bacterium]